VNFFGLLDIVFDSLFSKHSPFAQSFSKSDGDCECHRRLHFFGNAFLFEERCCVVGLLHRIGKTKQRRKEVKFTFKKTKGLSMAPTFPAVYNLTGNYMNVTGRISALFVMLEKRTRFVSFVSNVCLNSSSAFGEMVLPYLIGKLFHVSWASYVSLFPVVAISSFVSDFLVFFFWFWFELKDTQIGLLSLAVALLLTRNISVASHSQSHLVLSSGSEREATESDFERKLDEFGGLEDGLSDFDLL
jgi:hypothetical protein